MNCAECRENLVACVEGLLEDEQSRHCQAHLEGCADCRAEYAAIAALQQQLAASGRVAAEVSVVGPVMRRVRQQQTVKERSTIMSRLFTRWGLGLGAAATAAAVIVIIGLTAPKAQAKAAEVMAKGAQAVAKLTSIHFRGQMRTLPADNFSMIGPQYDLVPVELWKQFGSDLKWRVEKPGRVAVMDGQSTLLYIKPPANLALKVPQAAGDAFDTHWLHQIANLSQTLTEQLKKAQANGWKLDLAEAPGADGRTKSVVTIHAKAPLPDNDIFKNKFFDLSDTRQVYQFDTKTELLDSVQAYLVTNSGEALIFELTHIDYNQPIDATVFQVELPANVNWYQNEMPKLPDNEKYAAMTAQQAARAFFEACAREDWTEVQKFWRSSVDDRIKQYLGGLELVSLGEPVTSALAGTAQVVPYEIKLKSGYVKKHGVGLKKDGKTGRWYVDGGI